MIVKEQAKPGQSAEPIDGLYLWEPSLTLQRTKPACRCDDRVAPAWTFAEVRQIASDVVETYCRSCGSVGKRWTPEPPDKPEPRYQIDLGGVGTSWGVGPGNDLAMNVAKGIRDSPTGVVTVRRIS